MLSLAYLGVILLILFLESVSKKRISGVLPFLLVIYSALMMGGNTNNPDTIIYNNIYYNSEFFSKDFGFGILVELSKVFGIKYEVFKLILSTVGILLIHSTVKKYVNYPPIFYILYFVYPFMMDVVQVRNFLIMSIFIYSIPWLTSANRKDKLKYLMAMVVAATIQKTAIVYLPLVFIDKLCKRKNIKLMLLWFITFCILIGLNKNVVYLLAEFLFNNFSDTLVGVGKFLQINTNYGWIIQWGTQITNFLLILLSRNIIVSNKEVFATNSKLISSDYNKIYNFCNVIFWINVYAFVFLPLYVMDINFYRIMRNIYPLNLMVFCITSSIVINRNSVSKKMDKLLYIAAILVYTLITFFINYIYNGQGEYLKTIIEPLFKDNWIF
ncbi:EpsG family protein [Gracilibacillus sp. Marseille-QA3620]